MFPQIGVPQIIHLNSVFHYKPSILELPLFLETLSWNFPTPFQQCLSNGPRGFPTVRSMSMSRVEPEGLIGKLFDLENSDFPPCNPHSPMQSSAPVVRSLIWSWSTYPPRNKGLNSWALRETQWFECYLKAGLFLGGKLYVRGGG